MSYCHTTSTGKTLVFHPLVETYALEPGIEGAGCYTFCEEYTPPECAITGITPGNQMACDPVTGLYTQQIFVSFEYPPADGFLSKWTELGFNFSPQAITIVGEPANGESVDVTAFFTTDEGCALSVPDAYTRRDPCCGNLASRSSTLKPTSCASETSPIAPQTSQVGDCCPPQSLTISLPN